LELDYFLKLYRTTLEEEQRCVGERQKTKVILVMPKEELRDDFQSVQMWSE
jgi:hypothetical protein